MLAPIRHFSSTRPLHSFSSCCRSSPQSGLLVAFFRLIVGIAIICVWSAGLSWADALESALMPGQVIEGHATWEEDCAKCHKRFDKAAQSRLCGDCHKDIRKDIEDKQRFHGQLTTQRECRACHTDHKGRKENIAPIDESTFDHSRTNFSLNGAHANSKKAACKACHKPKIKFRNTPSDCLACHRKDDAHKGHFGEKCIACHTDNTWKEIIFNHDQGTKYPLLHKHLSVKCERCHAGHLYKDTLKTDCFSCHKKADYHKGIFGQKCETCHSEKDWKVSPFHHDTDTKYPLLGKHRTAKCEICHRTPVAKEKTPTACYTCHKKDDKHEHALGPACEQCHTEKEWKDVHRFDHNRTAFPLLGKHDKVACKNCHANQRYKPTPSDCYSCHKKDDTHQGMYGETCRTCHTDRMWKEIAFDHNRDTKYSLKGKHKTTQCNSCHKGHLYKEKAPADCYACHKKDDKHNGQEGRQCESCHGELSWKTVAFDHDTSRFPLRGQHSAINCNKCHATLLFKDVPLDCIGCHEKEDVHKRRLSKQCENCHTARGWKLWDFDHNLRTKFLLDGVHKTLDCYDCHKKPMETTVAVPSTCIGCHRKNDEHEGKLGPHCERCHYTSSWKTTKSTSTIRK